MKNSKKNYFEGDFDIINTPLNSSFSYNDVENLLLGKPFADPSEGRWKQISNPQYYIFTTSWKTLGNYTNSIFMTPTTFLLKEQRLLIPGTSRTLTIKYLNHSRLNGETLPQNIEISLFDGKNFQRLDLEFTRTDFPNALNFPFEIPRRVFKNKVIR